MRGSEGIVPVMEVGNNNNGGFGGFGNNGDWAWIIILFLIFGFNGNRGFGGGYGGGSGVADNYILQSDFSQLSRQISDGFNATERRTDQIINGLCDGFYNTLGNFNTTNMNIAGGFARLDTNLCQLGNNITNSINGVSTQLASCCCDIGKSLLENRYLDERNTCNIINAMNMNTRDLLENANANYRALHEELVANKLEMKNERIAEQQNEINALRLKASQEAQSNYIVSRLTPKCPEPAYVVNSPTPVNFPTNCCGTFTGFGTCGNQYL